MWVHQRFPGLWAAGDLLEYFDFMKNHELDPTDNPHRIGEPAYSSEDDDYPPPLPRHYGHPIEPRMKALLAKQPRRPIDADMSDEPMLA
jgi:hypothetical protein